MSSYNIYIFNKDNKKFFTVEKPCRIKYLDISFKPTFNIPNFTCMSNKRLFFWRFCRMLYSGGPNLRISILSRLVFRLVARLTQLCHAFMFSKFIYYLEKNVKLFCATKTKIIKLPK